MKVIKGILSFIGVLLVIVLVAFLVSILCKACGWLPNITEWLDTNIYSKIGLTFFSNLGNK